MNLLIQKLREGETEYQKGAEEGQLIPIQRAPTRTALWAANEIEKLGSALENLSASHNMLMQNYNQLQEAYNQCLQSIQKLTETSQTGEQMQQSTTTNSPEPPLGTNSEQPTNNQS